MKATGIGLVDHLIVHFTDYIVEAEASSSEVSRHKSPAPEPSPSKRRKKDKDKEPTQPPSSSNADRGSRRIHIYSLLNRAPSNKEKMADGSTSKRTTKSKSRTNDGVENEARALRVLEIMNDFRTLQVHITSLVTRPEANPSDQSAYNLDGYAVIRQCNAAAQAILATNFNPGTIGLDPGQVSGSEVHKATLQRIILDASTRRFQAHKIYLRSAAALRWIQLRTQVLKGEKPSAKHIKALQAVDGRLRQELENLTDEHTINDLRSADRRKNYWLDEDPSLDRMLAWIRRQS
ncbi:hypothetical protein LTR66_015633 [Elasticomyces elasticus]|nr:hypothetical protein LTR66_015633 [Elasticomyces elasticus]